MLIILLGYYASEQPLTAQEIDPTSGLLIDRGYQTVDAYCIGCHTAKMITRRRKTRQQWTAIVHRMQEIDKNWKLTPNTEKTIVDYLSKNYGR